MKTPTESKTAAFEAHEAETVTLTPEEIWKKEEDANSHLSENVAIELEQFKHPEDYVAEPVPEHQIQVERISELLNT